MKGVKRRQRRSLKAKEAKERERERGKRESERTEKVIQTQSLVRLEISPNRSIITIYVNVLNGPIKNQRWSNIKYI